MTGTRQAMAEYRLTEVGSNPPSMARAMHGLAARSPFSFLRRGLEVASELAWCELQDRRMPLRGGLSRVEAGHAARQGNSLALYLHWSPDGRVSAMVLRQLALWRDCGFDVVFVSNAAPPPPDWAAVADHTVLRLQRANVGRDFGAWRDAAAEALRHLPEPTELLLANDSVLGPFLPLAPLVACWRSGGDGLFGMTESLGGGAHLQSYALLARGAGPVATMLAHLRAFRDHRSKWRVVQSGELGLTRRMLAAGHRCAALFGYPALCALVDPATRQSLGPRFAEAAALGRYPLNPTHHLWRVLVERMGFPYLKTELVRRNPGRLPGVTEWPSLVPATEATLIREHLSIMAGARLQPAPG